MKFRRIFRYEDHVFLMQKNAIKASLKRSQLAVLLCYHKFPSKYGTLQAYLFGVTSTNSDELKLNCFEEVVSLSTGNVRTRIENKRK